MKLTQHIIILTIILLSFNQVALAAFEKKEKPAGAKLTKEERQELNEAQGTNLDYLDRNIRGWKVRFHGKIIKKKILLRRLKNTLKEQLKRTSTRVPNNALKQLKKIPIYVYYDKKEDQDLLAYYNPNIKAVVFHDSERLQDLKNYKNAVVLHELSHGYHHQVLGYDNLEIKEAYNNAVETGLYREVRNIYSKDRKQAYAMTNHIEYFAELTESYFSKKAGKFRNDFYPFDKFELKKYDPVGYKMIKKMWRQ